MPVVVVPANSVSARDSRRAVTLVELLMVMAIIAMVTAVTVPLMKPALDGRRVRESARMVSSMLGAAQTRAVTIGRPVGVWFERLPAATGAPEASMLMFVAETPVPYSGGTTGATVTVGADNSITAIADTYWNGLIHNNDLIQINYQGPLYQLNLSASQVDPNTQLVTAGPTVSAPWTVIPTDGTIPPLAASPQAQPFQIFRQPVRASDPPIQLPDGAVVDLAWSGMGAGVLRDTNNNNNQFLNNPVLVMFSPNGALDSIYFSGGYKATAFASMFLLVGKREKLVNPPNGSTDFNTNQSSDVHNWLDTENIWVSVNYQTGLITSTEVAANTAAPPDSATGIRTARTYARQEQSMGGR